MEGVGIELGDTNFVQNLIKVQEGVIHVTEKGLTNMTMKKTAAKQAGSKVPNKKPQNKPRVVPSTSPWAEGRDRDLQAYEICSG